VSIIQQAHGFADYSTIIVYLLVCACVWHDACDQKKLQLAFVPNEKHNRFAVKTKQVCMNHQVYESPRKTHKLKLRTRNTHTHERTLLVWSSFELTKALWSGKRDLYDEWTFSSHQKRPTLIILVPHFDLKPMIIYPCRSLHELHANSRNCSHPASSVQLCVCACVHVTERVCGRVGGGSIQHT